jgi:hypothetical protein
VPIDRAFKWTQVAIELKNALEVAGYTVNLGTDGMSVERGGR